VISLKPQAAGLASSPCASIVDAAAMVSRAAVAIARLKASRSIVM